MTFTFEDCQRATVRIYQLETGRVCGTGFLIHKQYVLTCAHVINDALGIDIDTANFPMEKIDLDFPEATALNKRRGEVIVWKCPNGYSRKTSDIALVRLNKPVTVKPITLRKPLEIRKQKSISEDLFKLWGFPIGCDEGFPTEGKIVTEEYLRIDENMPRVIGGFSGAPVWDIATHQVVGMVVETDARDQTRVDSPWSGYDDSGFDGRMVLMRKLSVLADAWYKQGLFLATSRKFQLWEKHRDILLEAYHNIPNRILEDEPDTLELLFERISSSKNSDRNLICFVFYLLVKLKEESQAEQFLKKWLKIVYAYQDKDIKEKSLLLEKKLKPQKQKINIETDARLWLFFSVSENLDKYEFSKAYLLKGKDISNLELLNLENDISLDRSSLSEQISPLLEKVIRQAKKYGEFWIEVFLPYEGLDLDPDGWMLRDKYGGFTVGAKYPVVVRVLDRLIDDDEYTARWRSKWQLDKLVAFCQQILWCCDRPANELDKALDNGTAVGLSIKSPPQSHDHEPLPMIMRKGVPIALWLRKKLAECEAHEEYQKILNQTRLQNLPQELKSRRTTDPKNPDHLARHFTLLWDDPTVAPPPDFDFSFVDSAQKL